MIGRVRCGVVAALVFALTGCTQASTVTRLPDPTSTTPSSAPTVASTADLPALKQRTGIGDCPVSDPDVAVRPDGLPEVTLPCLGGGRETRLAGLRGRPMMINVWAQWCGPCRQEAPFLREVAAGDDSDLQIIGIDFRDPYPDLALEYAEAAGWTFPQLQDADQGLAALQITAPPVTLFVRADGSIAARHAGAFTSSDQIRGLLADHLGVAR